MAMLKREVGKMVIDTLYVEKVAVDNIMIWQNDTL
jgi:hypothetical protein